MSNSLENIRVAVLFSDGFEQSEMTSPRQALQKAGAQVTLISPGDSDSVRGWQDPDWGDTFQRDMKLEDAQPEDFDALLLPGGVLNPDNLKGEPKAVEFVRHFFMKNKPVAAICHAPQLLIEAGVVADKSMTSYHTVKTDLINAGANWKDHSMVRDHNLVTSRNPDDLPDFNAGMIELFSEAHAAA